MASLWYILTDSAAKDPEKVSRLEKELKIAKVSPLFTLVDPLDPRYPPLRDTPSPQDPGGRGSGRSESSATSYTTGNSITRSRRFND